MATIHGQLTLWSELERELPPGLQEVRDFLDTLSEFDEELVRELERQRAREGHRGQPLARGKGRDDLPVRAMWNLLATSLYLRNGKQSETLAELWRNSDLARLLGFREIGPNIYRLPSSSALSRFHVRLKEASSVREVFNHTVKALAEENPDFGKHTALDASDVRTHARAKKLRKEDTGTELTQNADESDNEPTRRTMTYAGAETDRSSHKFRCPLGAGAKDQCPFFDSCQAGPAGTQGRQVRISFETDIRRFAPIYPRSKRWKRLYNGRSAVERINSYAKEVLPLERHALRGKATIELRVLLAAITINVRTLNSLRRAKALADAA